MESNYLNNYFKHYNSLGKKKHPRKTNQRLKKIASTGEDSKFLRNWAVFKFYGNMAWYAVCPTCGHNYVCSTSEQNKDSGIIENKISKLYRYCPMCGQIFSLKQYIDYTDINIPGIEGFYSLVDIIKAYNYYDSIENEEERKKVLKEEYYRQWEEYCSKNDKDMEE